MEGHDNDSKSHGQALSPRRQILPHDILISDNSSRVRIARG
jgi:hypothetical protein